MPRPLSPKPGDLLVLVGTTKGAFIFHVDSARRQFRMSGPHLAGQSVHSVAYLPDAGRSRILLGNQSMHWGAVVSRSDDFGRTWHEPAEGNIRFPEGSGLSMNAVWALEPAPAAGPGVVYAGVEPAAIFRSDDGGETFVPNQAMLTHPHRPKWQPGGGGLCLHTIVLRRGDPARIHVAISTAGVYRSRDGGDSWERCYKGVRPYPAADGETEVQIGGQCAHKVRPDPLNPARLYLQNHPGVYRSDDDGDSWVSIGQGLPSDFGFPLVSHPHRADTAYVFPLVADAFRFTPDGAAHVWRTRDAGSTWEPLGKGLPQRNAYLTVLRDAFGSDSMEPAGLYFGTRGGQLFASNDEGESWRMLAQWLPPILCVKAVTVG